MASPDGSNLIARSTRLGDWLDRPLSGWWCALGWCGASAVFFGIVVALGGIGQIDTYQSVYSTWVIAHGQLECALPSGYRVVAPFYPLLSGGIAAATHIGNSVPFPSRASMGPHCDMAFDAINTWSLKTHAVDHTTRIAYVSWFFLLGGVVSLLRSSGRGRCGWEPTLLVAVACLPPVWLSVESTFHPQDLIAMGFALAALACARRGSWAGAGALHRPGGPLPAVRAAGGRAASRRCTGEPAIRVRGECGLCGDPGRPAASRG